MGREVIERHDHAVVQFRPALERNRKVFVAETPLDVINKHEVCGTFNFGAKVAEIFETAGVFCFKRYSESVGNGSPVGREDNKRVRPRRVEILLQGKQCLARGFQFSEMFFSDSGDEKRRVRDNGREDDHKT